MNTTELHRHNDTHLVRVCDTQATICRKLLSEGLQIAQLKKLPSLHFSGSYFLGGSLAILFHCDYIMSSLSRKPYGTYTAAFAFLTHACRVFLNTAHCFPVKRSINPLFEFCVVTTTNCSEY